MNTRRLPPTLLIALGLGCGDDGSSGETTTGPCLIAPLTESLDGTGSNTDMDTSEASTSEASSAPMTETVSGTTSESDTDPSTGSGTDTDTDTSSGSGTTGMGDAVHEHVVGRVLERGILPPDVAAKLAKR